MASPSPPSSPVYPMRPDDVVAPPHERGAYPGIEVVTSDLPQTVPQVEKELVDSTTTEPTPSLKDEPIEASSPPKKKSRKWILISGIAVLLVIIAIAVGVPVGLTKKNSSVDNSSAAFKGSRFTTVRSFLGDNSILFFYQTRNGSLAYAVSSSPGAWERTRLLDVSNVMEQSPLTASYSFYNKTVTPLLFYVDRSGIVQNIMLNATANTWKSGIMGNERIEVPQNPNLAFASAPGLRDEGSGSPTSSFAKGLDSGVWLFVGGHDGLVHEHIYNTTNNTWRSGMTFEGANGYSGAYVSRGLSVLSVTVTNSSGYLDHWLKDFSSNGTWAQHNEDNNRGQTSFSWYNASYATNTSICAPNNIFLQEPGGKIASVGFRLISDYVKYQEWQQSFGISNGTALNGTGIGCHYFEDTATMHRVFYQDEDGDVIEATRNYNTSKSSSQLLDAGKYTYSVVPLD